MSEEDVYLSVWVAVGADAIVHLKFYKVQDWKDFASFKGVLNFL